MGKKGKFFYIRSKEETKLVLDVEGGDCKKGNKVILYEKHGGLNQLWCYDYAFNVIRSRMDEDYCLDEDDDNLVINKFKQDKKSQRFVIEDDQFIRQISTGRVLDIEGGDVDEGTKVLLWEFHGRDNQKFKLKYTRPKRFLIKSKLNGKVMDIEHADDSSGQDIIMYEEHGNDNQQWYADVFGHVYSKLNGMTISTEKSSGIRTAHPMPIEKDHNWVIAGKRIVNLLDRNECLDIEEANEDDGAKIIKYDYQGSKNQKWKYDYKDGSDDGSSDSD